MRGGISLATGLAVLVGAAACGPREATTAAGPAANSLASTSLQPVNAAPVSGEPLQPAAGGSSGYSCSFPGADGRTILARFTLDGANARDDEGVAFRVLADSPTAVVLARPRDDVSGPSGDVGAYVVAIDKRDLSMVQSTVGVKGAAATRKGRCIAG